ncbi:MAG: hypothetical protein ACTH5C_15100, partial [Pseudoalteromonas prydzensis]
PRYALRSAVSVGSHYREIQKQINPFLKKTLNKTLFVQKSNQTLQKRYFFNFKITLCGYKTQKPDENHRAFVGKL